jgi:class 3 adenylate cyclase
MSLRRFEVTRRRVYDAPRALVWALVADSNRWDRASGLEPGQYSWREVDGVWSRVAKARELGFALEWIEPPYLWAEGRFLHGERVFVEGPTATGGFEVRLDDVDGGTEVVATAYVDASGPIGSVTGVIMRTRFGTALNRYFQAIGEVIARSETEGDEAEPAVMAARRALMNGFDEVTAGHRSECNHEVLSRRAARLIEAGVEPEVADAIVAHLRDRPDDEVSQIRPFELARVWGLDRRAVLRGFLHATVAGLTDLKWQINCPVCRVSAGVTSSLEDVRESVHCDACNIGYDLDFGKHVEAVFQSNPAVREVHAVVYCASSPTFLPHVFAQLRVAGGDELEEMADVPRGELHLRTLVGRQSADPDLSECGSSPSLEIVVSDETLDVEVLDDGEGRVRVKNEGSGEDTVLFERAGWTADAVLGNVVASFPEFVDLFATEAPASGVELSIGTLSLLFSDLTGSTALYERIGDAKAFALVEEHFELMDAIVREHGGALIKTMGDAVMASFSSSVGAVKAALQMVNANEERFGEHGLAVRIGVHEGPCLAVRANDRLDFFGTTVNVAARLEGKAKPGHVVLTDEMASSSSIAALITSFAQSPFEADLKGISETQKLVMIDAREKTEAAKKTG